MADRARILIVDDEPFNIDLIEQELEELGYQTESATDGQQALARIAADPPDLVLLDVMMPVMDGFSTCRALKQSEATQLIPVILLTALGSIEDRVRGIEAGADDFLTKPVDDRELKARIQTALRSKSAVDQRVGQVARVRDHLEKFVPEAVRRWGDSAGVPPEEAPTEQDVSALVVDISGYSRLSETLPLREVNRLVERYFTAFLDRIAERGGDVSNFSGDGFLAIFRGQSRHAHAAADAALALLEATGVLNTERSGQPLDVHLGLSSGIALVGTTCFDGARNRRWLFTATGPSVNLAARLAGLATAGQVLTGGETWLRLRDGFEAEPLGAKSLKNIAQPVEVYRLVARRGQVAQAAG